MRRREDDAIPEHLREWPTSNLADLRAFYEERIRWARDNGQPKLPVLIEYRERKARMLHPAHAPEAS